MSTVCLSNNKSTLINKPNNKINRKRNVFQPWFLVRMKIRGNMPCNCSGVHMSTCSCKLVPKSFLRSTEDLVLVQGVEKRTRGFVYRKLEALYEKCAGYNLRYCPLRGVARRGKCLSSAIKDLMILACFLVANFVVFLNILTKMAVHIYYVLKETAVWIRSRSILKSECNDPFYFEAHFKEHDYTPPAKFKLF